VQKKVPIYEVSPLLKKEINNAKKGKENKPGPSYHYFDEEANVTAGCLNFAKSHFAIGVV